MSILTKVKKWLAAYRNPAPDPVVALQGRPLIVIKAPITELDAQRFLDRIRRLEQHVQDRPDLDTTDAIAEIETRRSLLQKSGIPIPEELQ